MYESNSSEAPFMNSLLDNIKSKEDAHSLAVYLWKLMMDSADDELMIEHMGCKTRSEFLNNSTILFLYLIDKHDNTKEYIEMFKNILFFRGDMKNHIYDYIERYFYCE